MAGYLFFLNLALTTITFRRIRIYLSNHLLNSFEYEDEQGNWVDSVIVDADTFYFPYKYKSATEIASVTEYQMVLRLGEQYLVEMKQGTARTICQAH